MGAQPVTTSAVCRTYRVRRRGNIEQAFGACSANLVVSTRCSVKPVRTVTVERCLDFVCICFVSLPSVCLRSVDDVSESNTVTGMLVSRMIIRLLTLRAGIQVQEMKVYQPLHW
jgi:hypothetical protein